MDKVLRDVRPWHLRLEPKGRPATRRGVFTGIIFCLLLQFFVTSTVLSKLGVTGNMRIHPANVLLLFIAIYAVGWGGMSTYRRWREAPALLLYVCCVPLAAVYAIVFNGISGAGFYLDSFWAAGLVGICLQDANDRQRRLLGRVLIWLVVVNALLGLYESIIQSNFFPFIGPDLDDLPEKAKLAQLEEADFRANAFYPHPLTASFVTALALFLVYAMRMRFIFFVPVFLLFIVSLLAFGGRTALGTTVVTLTVISVYTLFHGILHRNLKTVMYTIAAVILIPPIVIIIVTETNIAQRVVDTLYFDDSASVRVMQWRVLEFLSLHNWLFGIPPKDLDQLKYTIGITGSADIENFWLLLFLNLGAIGFVGFLTVFFVFLRYIANLGGMYGWFLMLSGTVIDSSSNSLGTKSGDLWIETAMLIAMAGFIKYKRPLSRLFRQSAPRGWHRTNLRLYPNAHQPRNLRARLGGFDQRSSPGQATEPVEQLRPAKQDVTPEADRPE